MTWLASLGWRDALIVMILTGIVLGWLVVQIERYVRRAKARRRRHRLDRLNSNFFRQMTDGHYRVRK